MQVTYFDGRQARAHDAVLEVRDGRVRVVGSGIERDEPIESMQISDWLASTPRFLLFSDGAVAEACDGNALGQLLEPHVAPNRVTAWERARYAVPVAIGLILAIGVLGYRFALPAVADVVARRLPARTTQVLSNRVLELLDRTVFQPTRLTLRRRAEIIVAFGRLRVPGASAPHLNLAFRDGNRVGANAMALPSGTIVVTDALVELLSDDDNRLVAVLAHEAGHVSRRHGLRNLSQASMLALLFTWYIGDVSALAAAAPTVMLQARYSRDFERDADRFAVDILRLNGLPPSLLAEALERLEAAAVREGRVTAGAMGYLSTHPATAERLAAIRAR
jgi:Zn-dependent protease with chaperone function